jgi:hypothetical protein
MEEEASGGGAGVDCIGKAFELHAPFVQFADEVHKVFYASAKPVQFPDDECVALPEGFLHFGKSWPLGVASADFVVKDLLATGLCKSFGLEIQTLILGRDAGVADQHGNLFCSSQNS